MPHPASIRPSPYTPPTREQIERARAMYAEGFTVSRVLAATDMSLGTLYYWLDGGPTEGDKPLYPPIPRRRQVVGKRRKPLSGSHVSLVARLYRTAERQACDIEERLARPSAATPAREREVRMLASLVQSVRTLASLAPEGAGGAPAEPVDDDPVPKDIDEFRYELARRIYGFIEARQTKQEAEQGKEQGQADAFLPSPLEGEGAERAK
jgi:hypothetical protein